MTQATSDMKSTVSEKQKTKSWLQRGLDLVVTLSVIVLLLIFFINQIDQFFDTRRAPTVIHAQDGIKCVHYRGAMGCVQVFKGTSI